MGLLELSGQSTFTGGVNLMNGGIGFGVEQHPDDLHRHRGQSRHHGPARHRTS